MPTTASADFSQFVFTTANETVCETSRGKSPNLSSFTCPIYATGLRLPFGLCCFVPAYPPVTPWYRLPVRRATISLWLLLPCSSRCKACQSLSGSLATTPLGTSTQASGHARHTYRNGSDIRPFLIIILLQRISSWLTGLHLAQGYHADL